MINNQNVFAEVIAKDLLEQVNFQKLVAQIERRLVPQYLKQFYATVYTKELDPKPDNAMKERLIEFFQKFGWKVKITNRNNWEYEYFEFL